MKKLYIAPTVELFKVEVLDYMAISIDTSKVEWKDDVNLEVKEDKGNEDYWNSIW